MDEVKVELWLAERDGKSSGLRPCTHEFAEGHRRGNLPYNYRDTLHIHQPPE